eukprot:1480656-Pleurochrysis_carterae.AAC.2
MHTCARRQFSAGAHTNTRLHVFGGGYDRVDRSASGVRRETRKWRQLVASPEYAHFDVRAASPSSRGAARKRAPTAADARLRAPIAPLCATFCIDAGNEPVSSHCLARAPAGDRCVCHGVSRRLCTAAKWEDDCARVWQHVAMQAKISHPDASVSKSRSLQQQARFRLRVRAPCAARAATPLRRRACRSGGALTRSAGSRRWEMS